jgi:hypothetical protein
MRLYIAYHAVRIFGGIATKTIKSPCYLFPWWWRQQTSLKVGKLMPDYTAQQPRRQPSSIKFLFEWQVTGNYFLLCSLKWLLFTSREDLWLPSSDYTRMKCTCLLIEYLLWYTYKLRCLSTIRKHRIKYASLGMMKPPFVVCHYRCCLWSFRLC